MKVLILGANSDVAKALALLFAKNGFELMLAGRSEDRLRELELDLINRFKTNVNTLFFDAENQASHSSFYAKLTSKPDIVICAFGFLPDQEEAQENLDVASMTYSVNMMGAISILEIVAKDFAQRNRGVIVGISSVAGDRGRGSNYFYGSAKAGFSTYLSGLRNRLYSFGVHVLTVKPGFIQTNMTSHLDLPKFLTASPELVAKNIILAIKRKRNIIYVRWFWRFIMLFIRLIPETVFKRLNL